MSGVVASYFSGKGTELASGAFFDGDSVWGRSQDVVIFDNVLTSLFAKASVNPIGQVILVGRVPCRIVGVTRAQQAGFGPAANATVYLPYTTVQARFLGANVLRSVSVRIDDSTPMSTAEGAVTKRRGI